jgi:hypothetical protein
LSKPIVVAVGPSSFGRIELIAQKREDGICLFVSYLKTRGPAGSFCTSQLYPPFEGAIEAFAWGWTDDRTQVEGTVTDEVESVTLRLEANGQARSVRALLANPDSSILQRLHVKRFNYFFAVYRGCHPPHKIVAVAHDSAGAELGRSRGFKPPKGFGNPCRSR